VARSVAFSCQAMTTLSGGPFHSLRLIPKASDRRGFPTPDGFGINKKLGQVLIGSFGRSND
jgi:hypothetical protein